MTDAEAPFLAAVLADPDSDTPRLIYADWLEENAGTVPCPQCKGKGRVPSTRRLPRGAHPMIPVTPHTCPVCRGTGHAPDGRAARAEFIRVQCELALPKWAGHRTVAEIRAAKSSVVGCCDRHADMMACDCLSSVSPEYDALRHRERELWIDGLLAAVKSTLPFEMVLHRWEDRPCFAPSQPEGYVRRGFVEAVTCTWAMWREHGRALVAAMPVAQVTLTTRPAVLRHAGGMAELVDADDYDGRPVAGMAPGGITLDDGDSLSGETDAEILALLKAEYGPGIRFTLPDRHALIAVDLEPNVAAVPALEFSVVFIPAEARPFVTDPRP